MQEFLRRAVIAFALGLLAMHGAAAAGAKQHRLAVQVDQNDPAVMNMALNNATHVIEYYRGKGEKIEIEIVAYGPGLTMLREDTSPVKDAIKRLAELGSGGAIRFSACRNTMQGMEKREGHPISLISQATVVPAGVVRLMELQEQGWSYLRP